MLRAYINPGVNARFVLTELEQELKRVMANLKGIGIAGIAFFPAALIPFTPGHTFIVCHGRAPLGYFAFGASPHYDVPETAARGY